MPISMAWREGIPEEHLLVFVRVGILGTWTYWFSKRSALEFTLSFIDLESIFLVSEIAQKIQWLIGEVLCVVCEPMEC